MTSPISQLTKELNQSTLMRPSVLNDHAFSNRIKDFQENGLKAQKVLVTNHELMLKGEVKMRELNQYLLSAISTLEKDLAIHKWELKKTNQSLSLVLERLDVLEKKDSTDICNGVD